MMWADFVKEARALLLVGECNFSFTVSLLEFVDCPSVITSTCLETDPEEQPRKANIELLRNKGVRILLGVDATRLEENHNLDDKYDCIIFNFPHIGGKSRIHLNRKLLCSFFSSASSCLDDHKKSHIIVTLCQGQGGVPCDQPRRQRAYGDTWKAVEMAAYGGLILEKIELFQAKHFQGYVPSGYGKHGEKGFHVDDSLSYIFCKSRPHRMGLPLGNELFSEESLHGLLVPDSINTHFGSITCSRVHASSYFSSPITSAAISYALQYLIEHVNVKQIINADEKVPLHISSAATSYSVCGRCSVFSPKCKMGTNLATCSIDGSPAFLRDSLVYTLQYLSLPSSMVLIKGHVFHGLGDTFSIPPVGAEAMLSGEGSTVAVLNALSKLAGGPGQCVLRVLNPNDSSNLPHSECIFSFLAFEIISLNQMLVLGHLFCGLPGVKDVCTVNLDNIAMMISNASDWREIRCRGSQVLIKTENGCSYLFQDPIQLSKSKKLIQCEMLVSKHQMQFAPESLYPPTFSFDVCFSECENSVYSEKEFWSLLWHLLGDVVISVELIDCYHPPPERIALGHRTSWCFRLKYCSYEWPLHRKSVVRIQNEVLHWGLMNILGLSVK